MILHTSLKFLTLLALPFAELVANVSPTPDTRLDITIAIAEHDGSFAPSGHRLIYC